MVENHNKSRDSLKERGRLNHTHNMIIGNHSHWASEASPTLGCSIEISRGMSVGMYVCMYVCRMSNHVESRESNTRMLKVSIGR